MSYTLLDSVATVQVFSPTLVTDALLCTISSAPSGSTLIRTIPKVDFDNDQGTALLNSLSDAVENLLQGGVATSATGAQGIDASNLLTDLVVFTVTYVPSQAIPGQITGTVEIPVTTVTADTSFGSFLAGGSAEDQIQAEYAKLQALAGG